MTAPEPKPGDLWRRYTDDGVEWLRVKSVEDVEGFSQPRVCYDDGASMGVGVLQRDFTLVARGARTVEEWEAMREAAPKAETPEEELVRLRDRVRALEGEVHRLTCSDIIEGDGICEHELAAANLRQELSETKPGKRHLVTAGPACGQCPLGFSERLGDLARSAALCACGTRANGCICVTCASKQASSGAEETMGDAAQKLITADELRRSRYNKGNMEQVVPFSLADLSTRPILSLERRQ